jgi:hypothetical protein
MSISRLRFLDEGHFKQIKLELSQEELHRLSSGLREIISLQHQEFTFITMDSDPKLTIRFEMEKKVGIFEKVLMKFFLPRFVVLLWLLGIFCLFKFIFYQ